MLRYKQGLEFTIIVGNVYRKAGRKEEEVGKILREPDKGKRRNIMKVRKRYIEEKYGRIENLGIVWKKRKE